MEPYATCFESTCFTCEVCSFGIIPFWTASECPREHAYDNEMQGLDSAEILVA
jgi:hypothetical protein